MPFADQLLEQAQHLARREKTKPKQASLRRAVSTAYYALFHLLVSEATKNWKRVEQRDRLARAFDHGRMKSASERRRSELNASIRNGLSGQRDAEIARQLHIVVDAFIEEQQNRHAADYDNARHWTRTEALEQIETVANAFQSWQEIRDEEVAQAYLVSLLGPGR